MPAAFGPYWQTINFELQKNVRLLQTTEDVDEGWKLWVKSLYILTVFMEKWIESFSR